MFGVDATITEADNRLDASANYVSVPDATTYTVLSTNSGKVHLLPDFAAACTITLPTPTALTAGLEVDFIYVGGALDAHGIILTTASDTNYFVGGMIFHDLDAGAGSDETAPLYPDGNSNSKLTATSVGAGTHIKIKSLDGVLWTILVGRVAGNTIPTFADQ